MRTYVLLLLFLLACAPAHQPVVNETSEKKMESLATLAVHSGEVFVNDGSASAGMDLHAGDIIKTMAKSKASVVFFDSSVLRLDENTEIVVKKLAKGSVDLKQSAGQTWSRVLKLSGIQEYTIETPNTVATVRGTGFAVKVSDGDTKVMVKEGKVRVVSFEENVMVAEAMVTENMGMIVTDEAPSEMEMEFMGAESWVDENFAADDEFIDEVVHDYMEENSELFAKMNLTAEEMEASVEDFATGQVDEIGEIAEEPVEEVIEQPEEVVEEPIADVPAEDLPEEPLCKDLCGDGVCAEIVCLAIGCPCAETPDSCPQDCKQISFDITNFDECARAGFPIMESYPRQCRSSDGRTFVEEPVHNEPPANSVV